jgi:hypothetical protein
MQNTLESWVTKLSFNSKINYKNLTFIPVVSNDGTELQLLTLNKAIEEKLVVIKEIGNGATVPEITVINKAKEYVLIIDGEHLIGAKQNRIVNKTIIVPPQSEIRIPVTCTEQGRWHLVSKKFSKSRYGAPSSIRKIFKYKESAQYEVWEEVERKKHSFRAHSPTSNLHEIYTQVDSSMEEYKKAIPPVSSQVGFMVFINGEFSGLDIVGDPKLFSVLFNDLISGYIMDAMDKSQNEKKGSVSEKDKEELIEEIIKTKANKLDKEYRD